MPSKSEIDKLSDRVSELRRKLICHEIIIVILVAAVMLLIYETFPFREYMTSQSVTKTKAIERAISPEELQQTISYTSYDESSIIDYSHIGLNIYHTDNMLAYIKEINPKISEKKADRIVRSIVSASKEFGVSPTLLLSLIKIESSFITTAVSEKGAVGLMQVNPAVWLKSGDSTVKGMGIASSVDELRTVENNIRAGAYILSVYMSRGERKKTDPIRHALTSYLGGTDNRHYDRVTAEMVKFIEFSTNS